MRTTAIGLASISIRRWRAAAFAARVCAAALRDVVSDVAVHDFVVLDQPELRLLAGEHEVVPAALLHAGTAVFEVDGLRVLEAVSPLLRGIG